MPRRGFAFLIALVGATPFAWAAQKAVVIVPVADLRSDQSLPTPGVSDDKQQTQLLFGETVDIVASSGDWIQVNAIDQPEFTTHQKWEGYPGWVLKSAIRLKDEIHIANSIVAQKWLIVHLVSDDRIVRELPLGARISIIPRKENTDPRALIDLEGKMAWAESGILKPLYSNCPADCRQLIIDTAKLLIGDPYVWGGLSPFDETRKIPLTGIDCSGLTQLSYRVNGLTIPRDSMEQYMKSEKIKRADLKPADLIFSSKADNPKKITHVALYAGTDQIIEAPQTGMVVRQVAFKEKYGKDLSQVESGDTVGDRVVYFGRFIKD